MRISSWAHKAFAAVLLGTALAVTWIVVRDQICLTRCIVQGSSFHYLDDELVIVERLEDFRPPAVIVVAASGETGGVLSVGGHRNIREGYWLAGGPRHCEVLLDCRNEVESIGPDGKCSSYEAVNHHYEVAFRYKALDADRSFVYFGPRSIAPGLDKFAREYSGRPINCH